jgi:uncharacterized glyoxalase superfamily protein PhnB
MALQSTTPVFLVGDIATTLQWYRTNLQFEGRAIPDEPPHAFAIMEKDRVQIFLQQLAGYQKPDLYHQRDGGVWHAYVHTDGVRELYEAVSKRVDVVMVYELRRQEYGQIEFAIKDPNGYVLVFAQAAEEAR